jgi:hypothetical protein
MRLYILSLFVGLSLLGAGQTDITWSASVDVAPASNDNLHPRLALDGDGNPLVLWGKSSGEAKFARWNGSAFTMPVSLNPMDAAVFTSSWAGPDIASSGDTVYAVFKQSPEDEGVIFIVRSTDGGMSFGEAVQVENIGDSLSRFPTVAIDGNGNPVVGFMKFNSEFGDAQWAVARSNDMGQSFNADAQASGWGDATVCDCCPGGIVASGDNVAMLYRNNAGNIRDTWAALSNDGGMSFPDGVNVDQQNWMLMSCPSSGPDGFMKGDTLYSVFMNGSSGTNLVYFSKTSMTDVSSDGGTPLTGDFSGLNSQNFIRIANDGNAAVIAWKQVVSSQSQLALLYTSEITSGWPTEYSIPVPMHVVNVDVAMSGNEIHLVWQDDNSGTVKYMKGTVSIPSNISRALAYDGLNVYPNPFTSNLSFSFAAKNSNLWKIQLTDVTGQVVFSTDNASAGSSHDVSSFSPGVYTMTLSSGGSQHSTTIVKQ